METDRVKTFNKLYNNLLLNFNMRGTIDRAKYGRTTDMTICQNLFILCPDVEYELSRNKDVRDIVGWLREYNNYGLLLFDEYKNRLDVETGLIVNNINLIEKTERLDMNKVNSLPEDILNLIWDYLPWKEKGICILESEWSDYSDRLMKLKQKELVSLTNNMKIYYNKFYNRWSPNTHIYDRNFNRESFENIQNLEKDYIYNMKKIDIINWLRRMIMLHLNIEIRNKDTRCDVIAGGYYSLILIYIFLRNKEDKRLLLEESRKNIKRGKRRDREKCKRMGNDINR